MRKGKLKTACLYRGTNNKIKTGTKKAELKERKKEKGHGEEKEIKEKRGNEKTKRKDERKMKID